MKQEIVTKLEKLEEYLIQESQKINDEQFTFQLGKLICRIDKMKKALQPNVNLKDEDEVCTSEEE